MRKILFLLALPMLGQNYASYSTYPVARMSFLRHQFRLDKNAFGDSSLQGYWKLNEGSGNVAYDASGNQYNATFSGSPGGLIGYYSGGKTSQASSFFVSANSNYALTTATMTSMQAIGSASLCYWGKSTATGYLQVGKSGPNSNSYQRFNLDQGSTGAQQTIYQQVEASMASFPNYTNANVTSWSFYCQVLTSGVLSAFLNGASQSLTAGGGANASVTSSTWASFYIGRDVTNGAFGSDGSIQNVRIYSRALSVGEIQAIYAAENH